MPADQPNRKYFTYTDDNAATWNKFGSIDAACNAIDGSTALTGGARVFPAQSRRYRAREAVFQDPTTFRTKRCVVYTPTAFGAITGATTIAVNVQGEATPVTYSLSQKVAEKQPIAKASRNLADHA